MAAFEMTTEVARAKARKGHTTKRAATFRIDGDVVTMSEIAERLGITRRQAQTRMARERAKAGPVTWEGLA